MSNYQRNDLDVYLAMEEVLIQLHLMTDISFKVKEVVARLRVLKG